MGVATDIAGLVLAGGRSSRFGRDKAVEVLAGRPLLAWSLGHLQGVAAHVAVSAAPGGEGEALAQSLGVPVLADDPAHALGPLAGVCAGLKWAAAQGCSRLVTLPCDTPMADETVLARLLDAGEAVYAETDDGPQALIAVWPTAAGPDLARRLAAGEHAAVRAALSAAGAHAVLFENTEPFRNVNTPADLAELAARMSR